jgi:arylsulfatase
MVYTWHNATAEGRKSAQYFEVMGSRGIYKDGFFCGTFGPRVPWEPNATRMNIWDPTTDVWELYDLSKDFSQAHDLAQEMPEKVAEMKSAFLIEASANQVLPIGAGLYTIAYHPEEAPHSDLKQWDLFQGETRLAESTAPLYRGGFDSLAAIEADVPSNASGVLYCIGGGGGGFSVYMDGGYLHAEYMATQLYRYKAKSPTPISPGNRHIEVKMVWDKVKAIVPSGNLTMSVDGTEVAGMRVEKGCRVIFDAAETFDVGMDLGATVALEYDARSPFPYSGKIGSLKIKYITGDAVEKNRHSSVFI